MEKNQKIILIINHKNSNLLNMILNQWNLQAQLININLLKSQQLMLPLEIMKILILYLKNMELNQFKAIQQ